MAVTFQALGSPVAVGVSTNHTLAWPVHLVYDIGLLFVTTSGGGNTTPLSTPAGFTLIDTYTTGTGTAGTQLSVYWARATSTSMGNPTVTLGTDFKYGFIATFRGVVSSGNPYNVYAGGVKATASTTASISSITTTVPDTMVVNVITSDLDLAAAFVSSYVNANLTGITERFDAGTTTGGGGGISFATGDKATAGSVGVTTATVTSSINAFMSLALIPEPPITSFVNTFEGGVDGDEVTNSNSGGASGMQLVSTPKNTGTTLTFNSLQARGTLSMSINYAVNAAGYGIWNWTAAVGVRSVMRFYIYIQEPMQSTFFALAIFRSAAANIGQIAITSNQLIFYANASQYLTPFKLQANSWYRIEMASTPGTTTSNGRLEFAYYDNDSIEPIYSMDTGATVNMGTVPFTQVRLGSAAGPTPDPQVHYYDDLAVAELASGWIGPSVTGTTYDKNQFMPFF